MTQHNDTTAAPTPGPWEVNGMADNSPWETNARLIVSQRGGVVAHSQSHNARLIAAAPALAEALRDAAYHLSLLTQINDKPARENGKAALAAARAALKAAGLDK